MSGFAQNTTISILKSPSETSTLQIEDDKTIISNALVIQNGDFNSSHEPTVGALRFCGEGDIISIRRDDGTANIMVLRIGDYGSIWTADSCIYYPRPDGGDDWAYLFGAGGLATQCVSLNKTLILTSGTYHADSSQEIYPGLNLTCMPNVNFIASVAGGFPFHLTYSTIAGTTLSSATTRGLSTIVTIASIPVGSYIMVHAPSVGNTIFRRNIYRIDGIAGDGPFTLTLDRPVQFDWPVGSEVLPFSLFNKNTILKMNGAIISGIGRRAFNATCAWSCQLYDLQVDASGFIDTGISWDEGCYDCHSYRCFVNCDLIGCAIGNYTLETSEHTSHNSARSIGGNCGFVVCDNSASWLRDCQASRAVSAGINVRSTDATYGDLDTIIDGFEATSCGTAGVYIDNGSHNTKISNLHVLSCRDGIDVEGASDGVTLVNSRIENCSRSGLYIGNGTRTRIVSSIVDNCLYGCNSYCDCDFYGISMSGNSISIQNASTGTVRLRDFRIVRTSAVAGHVCINFSSGRLELYSGYILGGAGGDNGVYNQSTGTVLRQGVTTVCTGGGIAYLAANTNNSLIDLEGNDDSGSSNGVYPLGVNAHFNWGTFAATEATPVVIPCRLMKANSHIEITFKTLGGTQGAAPIVTARVAGTSFSVTATAGDTSTYLWRVIA